ncbi:glycoside hydrolase family 32 protein [Flavobacterium sp. DSR3-2]|uniref:glycoside hydrolase family 32 protein n=1 Tax=Flavobacterium sp. DSR3-2 TaxID=2804634 RepID=UPI003CF199AA
MKTKKLLPLVLCSAVLLSIGGCKSNSPLTQNTVLPVATSVEEQLYRPNFHFTPKKGWMNDPNGMFYANGYYHLFYQYYPDGNKWGPMHWGHAISKDLIKWEEQPIAIYPDNDKYIFSGSAVVDTHNTSGFGVGNKAPIVAIYTLHDMTKEKENKIDVEQQDIAYSNDNGFTWQKFEQGNPVVKNPGIRDFRDPKVTWDEAHKQWIMVLAAQDRSQFYKSKDLKNWEYASDFGKNIGAHGGVWECPDFFQIKVRGSNETKWVLIQSLNPGGANGGSGTQYFIGDFDGTTFTLDSNFAKRVAQEKAVWIDYGKDNYAGVTWNNIPNADGRRLFIGWMSNWEYAQQVPTNAWRSSTTIAREIQLIKKGDNFSLISNPVKEINEYISKTIKGKSLKGEGKLSMLKAGKIDLTQAIIEFNLKNLKQDTYTFTLSNAVGEFLTFGLNNSDHYLFLDRSKSGKTDFSDKFVGSFTKATLEGNQLEGAFKIILDKTSIEIFYNNGEKVITEIFFSNQPFTSISASSNEGIEISNLVINQLDTNKNQ